MRIIDAFDEPVRAVAVSPDGRFLAATSEEIVTVWSWGGDALGRYAVTGRLGQSVFFPDGGWLAHGSVNGPCVAVRPDNIGRVHVLGGPFSGGVAVSPDGRKLVATRSGGQQEVTLEMWELPSWRAASGFDYWSPFERLAFSPSGEFLAGINREVFELRYAESGGLNRREQRPREGRFLPARMRGTLPDEPARAAYLTFPLNSESVVYGWDAGFFVMETGSGNVLKRIAAPPDGPFLDAAFTGGELATIDGSPLLRLWSAESWEVVREYDWGAGELTCVTAAADGLAGVCGTDTGKLVVFDLDE